MILHNLFDVSEGIKDGSGDFVADSKNVDSFGHKQLGGVGIQLSNLITKNDEEN